MFINRDGKPYIHRKPTLAEDYRTAHVNSSIASQRSIIKPTSQGISKLRMEAAGKPLDFNELFRKLEEAKRETDKKVNHEMIICKLKELNTNKSHSAAQPRMIADVRDKKQIIQNLSNLLNPTQSHDDSQSILDHHVSSVFSPRHTPGSTSPKNLQRPYQRSNEMSSSVPDFGKFQIETERNYEEKVQVKNGFSNRFVSFMFLFSHATDTPFAFNSRECIDRITLEHTVIDAENTTFNITLPM